MNVDNCWILLTSFNIYFAHFFIILAPASRHRRLDHGPVPTQLLGRRVHRGLAVVNSMCLRVFPTSATWCKLHVFNFIFCCNTKGLFQHIFLAGSQEEDQLNVSRSKWLRNSGFIAVSRLKWVWYDGRPVLITGSAPAKAAEAPFLTCWSSAQSHWSNSLMP